MKSTYRLHRASPMLAAVLLLVASGFSAALAQEQLPWDRTAQSGPSNEDVYRERIPEPDYRSGDTYRDQGRDTYDNRRDDYRDAPAAPESRDYGRDSGYGDGSAANRGPDAGREPYVPREDRRYGDAYDPPRNDAYRPERYERYDDAPRREAAPYNGDGRPSTYSQDEIINAGHGFFGSVSRGLAGAIESLFSKQGRPNGYILGEDAGGAFVAGLRYGEGRLYTRDAGEHKVYWQGPTVGYDFGGEGSRVMVLVYNMRSPSDIYQRFGGVQGSAYLVGGVSVQLQQRDDVTLAPIRAGVGLRLGANVGYLKYTRAPTWNPF